MKIDVHARRFKLTESLRHAVHREIARLAQALGAGITRVSVRLFDVNGLRGGPDKGCLVHAQFTDGTVDRRQRRRRRPVPLGAGRVREGAAQPAHEPRTPAHAAAARPAGAAESRLRGTAGVGAPRPLAYIELRR